MKTDYQFNPPTGGQRISGLHSFDLCPAGGAGVLDLRALVSRPHYGWMPLARALNYDWRGYDLTEKMDGVWHELRIGASVVIGELMPDDSFYAFEIPIFDGRNLCRRPRAERMEILDTFRLRRPDSPRPGEEPAQFIQRVLAAGGEGIVAAPRDGFFGVDIAKVKRCFDYTCRVIEKHASKLSLHLEFENAAAGWCACLKQSVFDLIRPGALVEIRAYGRTARGKFREPRLFGALTNV